MKITILAVGKVKEAFYRQAIAEFQKRLGRYCRLEIIEVADEKTPDHASCTEKIQILEKEGQKLLKYIREDAWVCTLAIDGIMLDSLELSEKIEKLGIEGISHIQFVIGGSLGLCDSILKQADFKLSFSKMTFPHQLMRVILLEQIYRSYRIMMKEPYHK
ncbi:MAG: 23S rRNA (pseudouridine(1915)-N(3))-methyltransferase RlmH [Lachnospiraceae bacterium]|nr:23S rRNA (pseudouridine(1915)-N(3))-methyltransferase RlmH [Lachnospiraceae bacterium]